MSELGTFSVSLAVADIHRSKAFYEALGFAEVGGNIDENWIVLSSGSTVVGLFQGMFEKNIMTFNPGGTPRTPLWEEPDFTDVRVIQQRIEDAGIELAVKAEGESGPAHCVLEDPDGNQIMFDQHR